MEQTIHYRTVPFGTRFVPTDQVRPAPPSAQMDKHCLGVNEVALDVGGCCLGCDGIEDLIIDHHFHSTKFGRPSATAAALHLIAQIHGRLKNYPHVWIVVHENPDFDCFCAAFLVRSVLKGNLAAHGWDILDRCGRGSKPIDWLSIERLPRLLELKRLGVAWDTTEWHNRRWAMFLAAYASLLDNALPIPCSRTKSLHALLYAATVRRGSDIQENMGADILDAAVEQMRRYGLNPLYDALFDYGDGLDPELRLLDEDAERYRDDVNRALISIISVPKTNRPFHDWYEEECQQPLITVGEDQLPTTGWREGDDSGYEQVDGIFIRDPKSLLFKEWARSDREHAPSAEGFIFTMVAYTGQTGGHGNPSRYIISLDMERAQKRGLHLYPLWQCLQGEEIRLASSLSLSAGTARPGFEKRLADTPGCDDPWYDGMNYEATIIDTPNGGTRISGGTSPDLSDDGVFKVVARLLDSGIYGFCRCGEPIGVIEDFPTHITGRNTRSGENINAESAPDSQFPDLGEDNDFRAKLQALDAVNDKHGCSECVLRPNCTTLDAAVSLNTNDGALRFTAVPIRSVDMNNAAIVRQVARRIWSFIEMANVRTVPTDFVENHVYHSADAILVWNRRGIVVAYSGSRGMDYAIELRGLVRRFASAAKETGELLSPSKIGDAHVGNDPDHTQNLMRTLAQLRLEIVPPHRRPFGKLVEACNLDDIVHALHALNQQAAREEEEKRDKKFERWLTAAAAVLGLPSLFLALIQSASDLLNIEEAIPSSMLQLPLLARTLAFVIIPTVVVSLVAALLLYGISKRVHRKMRSQS